VDVAERLLLDVVEFDGFDGVGDMELFEDEDYFPRIWSRCYRNMSEGKSESGDGMTNG
jgi:hypothetical protein